MQGTTPRSGGFLRIITVVSVRSGVFRSLEDTQIEMSNTASHSRSYAGHNATKRIFCKTVVRGKVRVCLVRQHTGCVWSGICYANSRFVDPVFDDFETVVSVSKAG